MHQHSLDFSVEHAHGPRLITIGPHPKEFDDIIPSISEYQKYTQGFDVCEEGMRITKLTLHVHMRLHVRWTVFRFSPLHCMCDIFKAIVSHPIGIRILQLLCHIFLVRSSSHALPWPYQNSYHNDIHSKIY